MDGVSRRFDETSVLAGASWMHIIFRIILPQVEAGHRRRLHLQT